MDSTRWERIQSLFHEAADLPAPERISFLRTASGGDRELFAAVLGMLEEDARGSSLLDRDVAQVAGEMLTPAAASPPPLGEFGPYRIRHLLGEGGMGIVYLAEREDLRSLVAIKVLRDAWMSPSRRERFAGEQRTLAQLTHPSIARLYDADTLSDGTPWFAMEYVDGVPLTTYCSQHNCSIQERLRLLRAVADAVQYAHHHGVIHRDLKPSNILVDRGGTVRLLDFGIAKQLDPVELPLDRTLTGMRLMTPAYAAPEQIRGNHAGVRTDIYSLGVILYELLTGRLPFDFSNQTPAEADRMITEEVPAKPSAAARKYGTPPAASWVDLDVLCLTAMHKDPRRRYQSVNALIRDIDHYLNREPLEARPDRFGYLAGKFIGRNWRSLSAALLVFAVGVGLALLITLGLAARRASSPIKPKTVAVLPFRNAGSGQDLDFLRLALPDEIATELAHLRSLSIRPVAATSKYAEGTLDMQRAAREMRVTTIVTGHFLTVAEQLQITLEAFDTESNRVLWRDTFQVPARNMIAMQAQIAAKTRLGLAPLLGPPASVSESVAQPKNEEAYSLFLRSAPLPGNSAPNRRAIAMLERAVVLDPTYVPAWLALSVRHYNQARYGSGGEASDARSIAAAERARALDPDNVDVVAGLAIHRTELGEVALAFRDVDALVRRHADNGRAHFALSYVLRFAGLLEESATQCETALLLDAQTGGLRSCAVVFILRGDYPRAMEYIDLDRGSDWANLLSIDVLGRQGRKQDALQVKLAAVPQWAGFDLLLGYLRHRPADELAALAGTLRPVGDPEENYFAAAHLAYAGQTSAALRMLKRTVEGGYCSYPAIDADPFFAKIRTRPEFTEIRSAAIACQNSFLRSR